MPHLKVYYKSEERTNRRLVQTSYIAPRADQDVSTYGRIVEKAANELFKFHSERTYLKVEVFFTKKIKASDDE